MPWSVFKRDGRYCIRKDDGGDVVSCHDTEEEAHKRIQELGFFAHKDGDTTIADTLDSIQGQIEELRVLTGDKDEPTLDDLEIDQETVSGIVAKDASSRGFTAWVGRVGFNACVAKLTSKGVLRSTAIRTCGKAKGYARRRGQLSSAHKSKSWTLRIKAADDGVLYRGVWLRSGVPDKDGDTYSVETIEKAVADFNAAIESGKARVGFGHKDKAVDWITPIKAATEKELDSTVAVLYVKSSRDISGLLDEAGTLGLSFQGIAKAK